MEHWEDWQITFLHGTFVIWPPAEVREIVNAQREEYDPVSQSRIGAHITVTQPLEDELSGSQWDRISRILEGFEPFTIQYGPLKSFLPYPCIWYDIQPARAVLEIREALHQTGLFNLRDGYIEEFIPHMTITEGESGPEVTHSLLDRLQRESQSGSFRCEELVLFVPDSEFSFSLTRTIPLGKRPRFPG
jgi:2'-5' RNA ligase